MSRRAFTGCIANDADEPADATRLEARLAHASGSAEPTGISCVAVMFGH
jgi:hypothetical protein